MSISASQASARLEARITPQLHAMLKRAAEIQGRSMTDFVAHAVQQAAQQTIEQAEVIHLSMENQVAFANALISPPPLSSALERALARYDALTAQ
ncbi:MAG: DUF1778 domain-containing protein [Zoogloeaceae bacterium]|jgi:uncharacterized protein (DUF1778 family)|nr:DUF1778 domain-containing protein [Zoogloeaceae bacterium]